MAGTSWPSLTAGQFAKSSEVELKFDWMEGDIVPMNNGTKTDATYDLGTSSFRWRDGHFSGKVYVGTGSAAAPSLSISDDQDTGIFFLGNNLMGAAAGGVEAWRVNSLGQTLFANGTASAPSMAFTNDQTTGMYRPATATVAFVSAGAETLRIDSAGRITQPLNPAFMAYWNQTTTALTVSAGNTLTDTGIGSQWVEAFDRSGDFTAGVFHAPVDGLYEFHITIAESRTGSLSSCWVTLQTTARAYGLDIGSQDGGSDVGDISHAFSVIVNMSAGDTAYIDVHPTTGGGAPTFNILGYNSPTNYGVLTTFSGMLVG
jgi:hypothetical protein